MRRRIRLTRRSDAVALSHLLDQLKGVYNVKTRSQALRRAVSIANILAKFADSEHCIHLIDKRAVSHGPQHALFN